MRRRLLPALLRFGEDGSHVTWREEALRYLSFCLHHLHCRDVAVHQLAVAMYSLQVGGASIACVDPVAVKWGMRQRQRGRG